MRRFVPLILGPVLLLSMAPPAHAADTFVRHVIRTSRWATPSPDPTGLDFMRNGQLLVTDSEVDETRVNEGRNVWRITRGGHVKRAMSTYRFSHELTDVAVDGARDVWYFSTDVGARIFVVRLGPDGRYGTRDDTRRSFSTSDFGSRDPEGLAFGGGSLWISDGTTRRSIASDRERTAGSVAPTPMTSSRRAASGPRRQQRRGRRLRAERPPVRAAGNHERGHPGDQLRQRRPGANLSPRRGMAPAPVSDRVWAIQRQPRAAQLLPRRSGGRQRREPQRERRQDRRGWGSEAQLIGARPIPAAPSAGRPTGSRRDR